MSEDAIQQAVAHVTETIKSTACFQTYTDAKKMIAKDETLKQTLRQFKQADGVVASKKRTGAEISFDEEKTAANLYWQLMRNDSTKIYMESEQELIQLVQHVMKAVFDATGIDSDDC